MDPFLNPSLTFKATALALPELENMQIKLNVVLNIKNNIQGC
jgi:hypothetical protein